MITIHQTQREATQAVFESTNANDFTPSFHQSPSTTSWQSNLTKKTKLFKILSLETPIVDREVFFIPATIRPQTVHLHLNIAINTNKTNEYIELTQSKLCGMPAFCSSKASTVCHNVTLNQCEECSMTGAGIFAAVCVILGLLIVLGNGMVVCVIIKNRLNDGFSMMKVSLAASDALTGNIDRLDSQKTPNYKVLIILFVNSKCYDTVSLNTSALLVDKRVKNWKWGSNFEENNCKIFPWLQLWIEHSTHSIFEHAYNTDNTDIVIFSRITTAGGCLVQFSRNDLQHCCLPGQSTIAFERIAQSNCWRNIFFVDGNFIFVPFGLHEWIKILCHKVAVEISNQWQGFSTCRTFGSLDAIDTVSYCSRWIMFYWVCTNFV